MTKGYNPENYWDEVAGEISAREEIKVIAGDDEPYYRYKRARFLELLNSLDFSNKNVLEIGSGPGGNLEAIFNKGCKSITGVDISSQMIALAKQNLKGKPIDIHKINGKELPFEDNRFDIVFTSTVLQHNPNELILKALVKEICRVSSSEVFLFERIESTIKGHESNLGRPVEYYAALMKAHGFSLVEKRPLPIQVSYYTCGFIRKVFNAADRKEGQPLNKFSILLQNLTLPITKILDSIIKSERDVVFLRFVK